jgi:hypothetical protein
MVVTLTPEMSSSQAFKAIALACLRQLTDNVPVLRQGDPEGLHQARVAVRRLRAAMALFGELLRGDGSCAGEAVRPAASGKSVRSTVRRLHVHAPSAVSAATSAWTQKY